MFRSPLLVAALLPCWPAAAEPLTSSYVVERSAAGVDVRYGARPRTVTVGLPSRGAAWVYFASASSAAARASVQVARGGGITPAAEPAEACATVGPVPELIEARF